MSTFLGNLNVEQIETRLGIEFPEEIREFLKANHQASASNVAKGKWHCFDIPFTIVFGDIESAQKVYDAVKDRASEVKANLEFAIQ